MTISAFSCSCLLHFFFFLSCWLFFLSFSLFLFCITVESKSRILLSHWRCLFSVYALMLFCIFIYGEKTNQRKKEFVLQKAEIVHCGKLINRECTRLYFQLYTFHFFFLSPIWIFLSKISFLHWFLEFWPLYDLPIRNSYKNTNEPKTIISFDTITVYNTKKKNPILPGICCSGREKIHIFFISGLKVQYFDYSIIREF